METFGFETVKKKRWGQKAIIKRETGLKNKDFPLKILFIGAQRKTYLNTFIDVLDDNEFIYFDTETLLPRLDGVYGPTGRLRSKINEVEETIMVEVRLIEKEV